ncbi:MAG: ADP-ribosylglycohydrolase family protein, partial [Bacteroidales bacterium]|nr:ADP-ribosylglycohydrolase family protein [Bacteroidales bacterium]
NDWKRTWIEVEGKWSSDIGCPDGVFKAFNIDAKINAAYIVIGLLYGNGDYGKTIDISTRCGQDSDCNPASAAGILGTMLGYSNIPDYWKQGLDKVEDMDFKYTTISLNDVYKMGYKHALQNIMETGGAAKDNTIEIKLQEPAPVKYEKGFLNHFPAKILAIEESQRKMSVNNTEYIFEFEGVGFVVKGSSQSGNNPDENYNHEIEVYIDGVLYEKASLPSNFTKRRTDICWKYNLKPEKHTVKIKLINPKKNNHVYLNEILIYNNQP